MIEIARLSRVYSHINFFTPGEQTAWSDTSPHSTADAISSLLSWGTDFAHKAFRKCGLNMHKPSEAQLQKHHVFSNTQNISSTPVKPFPNSKKMGFGLLASLFMQNCWAPVFPTSPHEDEWWVLQCFIGVSMLITYLLTWASPKLCSPKGCIRNKKIQIKTLFIASGIYISVNVPNTCLLGFIQLIFLKCVTISCLFTIFWPICPVNFLSPLTSTDLLRLPT